MYPVCMLLKRGDRTFCTMLAALHCSGCKGKPSPVYIVAEQTRRFT